MKLAPMPGAPPDHAIIAPSSEHHNDCSAMRCKCNARSIDRSIHPLSSPLESTERANRIYVRFMQK